MGRTQDFPGSSSTISHPLQPLPGDVLVADAPAILQAIETNLAGIDLQMLRQHGDGICNVAVSWHDRVAGAKVFRGSCRPRNDFFSGTESLYLSLFKTLQNTQVAESGV